MKKKKTHKQEKERNQDLTKSLETVKKNLRRLQNDVNGRIEDLIDFCDRALDEKWCQQVKKSTQNLQRTKSKKNQEMDLNLKPFANKIRFI